MQSYWTLFSGNDDPDFVALHVFIGGFRRFKTKERAVEYARTVWNLPPWRIEPLEMGKVIHFKSPNRYEFLTLQFIEH